VASERFGEDVKSQPLPSTDARTIFQQPTAELLSNSPKISSLDIRLHHPPHISPYHKMASDEVYDGAIGIDLGMLRRARDFSGYLRTSAYTAQAPPTLALPTTRAMALRSVCDTIPATVATMR
jgi:hypothetical protein